MEKGKGLIIAGYICAFGALIIFPVGLGLAGVTIGIVNVTRGETGHGAAQIGIAVTCALLGFLIGYALIAGAYH